MLKITFSLIMTFAVSSCTSSTEPTEIIPSSEFYPLAIGNYWEYEVNFSSADSNSFITYKSIVTKVEKIGGYDWFKVETLINNSTYKEHLLIENDSVYRLQYVWQNPIRSLEYIVPKIKKESFHSRLGGDVGLIKTVEKLDTTIHTKIGDFSNCFLYKYTMLEATGIEVLAYGIGIIEGQFIEYNLSGDQISKKIYKILNAKLDNVP